MRAKVEKENLPICDEAELEVGKIAEMQEASGKGKANTPEGQESSNEAADEDGEMKWEDLLTKRTVREFAPA